MDYAMIIEMTEKQQVAHQLLVSKIKAYNSEIKYRAKGDDSKADEVKEHGKELSRKVDDVIAELMRDWTGDAEEIVTSTKAINETIQSIINKINKDIDTAEDFVKLIGLIDAVVSIAIGLLL